MKVVTLLLVGALVVAIWWKGAPARRAAAAAHAASSAAEAAAIASGWVAAPQPNGTSPNRVLIVAAPNCPSYESQRAVALARQLAARQIPCTQTGQVEFTFSSPDEGGQLDKVMNAGAPIVFVNGKAKSNPSLDEVVAEYRARARK